MKNNKKCAIVKINTEEDTDLRNKMNLSQKYFLENTHPGKVELSLLLIKVETGLANFFFLQMMKVFKMKTGALEDLVTTLKNHCSPSVR